MTTWDANIPPDPGTQITKVWDNEGDLWERVTRSSYWQRSSDETRKTWSILLYQYGPISDVPPGPEPPDDARYALAESGRVYHRKTSYTPGYEWSYTINGHSVSGPLPTNEEYTFLKEV